MNNRLEDMPVAHQSSLQNCFNGYNNRFSIKLMVATTSSGGIGFQGKLPWPKLRTDLQHFQHVTTKTSTQGLKNAVLMGKNTWFSIPSQFRPLPNRINFVLSSQLSQSEVEENVHIVNSYRDLFQILENNYQSSVETLFLIGGESIYNTFIESNLVDKIYLTRIGASYECDRFFPQISDSKYTVTGISKTFVQNSVPFDFVIYKRNISDEKENGKEVHRDDTSFSYLKNTSDPSHQFLLSIGKESKPFQTCLPNIEYRDHEEFQYLDMINRILYYGVSKEDRTGVGTFSTFGENMRFSLKDSFPLLTTKKVFWKGVIEELLWFISGDTNGKNLLAKKVKIWEKNGARDYLDSIGLTDREEHDLGPIYGFQWRHFGADYLDMHSNYSGQGIDQLQEVIEKLKNKPNDRRIILSAWNPTAIPKMALPPCHVLCQFYVSNGELSCLMFQRSCDMGLGVPFNIASYSLLTCMLAQVCGLKRGEFIYCLGDAHIYKTHVNILKQQLQRLPKPFPLLKLNEEVKDIEKFTLNDINLKNYNPHDKLSMEMAV